MFSLEKLTTYSLNDAVCFKVIIDSIKQNPIFYYLSLQWLLTFICIYLTAPSFLFFFIYFIFQSTYLLINSNSIIGLYFSSQAENHHLWLGKSLWCLFLVMALCLLSVLSCWDPFCFKKIFILLFPLFTLRNKLPFFFSSSQF